MGLKNSLRRGKEPQWSTRQRYSDVTTSHLRFYRQQSADVDQFLPKYASFLAILTQQLKKGLGDGWYMIIRGDIFSSGGFSQHQQ